jgi:DNA-binding CsgD family transcriptional regulator
VVCEALTILGEASFRQGRITEAVEVLERARREATAAGKVPWIIKALLELGAIEIWTEPTGRLFHARDRAAEAGAVSAQAQAELLIGWTHMLRFELDPAQEALERSLDLSRRFQLRLLPRTLIATAYLHAHRGQSVPLEEALAQAETTGRTAATVTAGVPAARGLLALVEERRADAVEWSARAVEVEADAPGLPLVPVLFHLLTILHDRDAKQPDVESAWAALPVNAAGMALVGCVALGLQGASDDASERFREADALLVPFPLYRHLGRRLVAEAALRDGWGSPGEWLRESVAFFEAAGLDRVADACKAIMRKAGAPVPRKGRGESAVPHALRSRGITSREMDILRLVRAGISNRRIAEQLFLSPRTVETHVANMVRKLGLDGRTQLVAFAEEAIDG